jgi:hypothetical protein
VTVADWLKTAIHNFSHLLSKLQVLRFTVVFDVTLSAANWYIFHKFSGDLYGKYPFLIGIDIFPQCLLTEFHLHFLYTSHVAAK